MTEAVPKRRDRTGSLGCLAIALLWVVLGLHFFADRIWDKEPPVLKWIVIGYGCLVLLGLLGSVVFGKRNERIASLVLLAIIAVAVALLPPREDRQAAADVDVLVGELREKGEAVERRTAALPEITDRTTGAELFEHLDRSIAEVQEQSRSTQDLMDRATELFGRLPPPAKREELGRAVKEYNERAVRAHEKRDAWIKQVKARVAALKKPAGEPK